ncbi:MAG: YhbY family RNA-binding protein [Clostridiales bacterium]|nr:YhbY family RNA-binding protein [Clostridiales bacterium]
MTLSSKQRAFLRGLSNGIEPVCQLGKDGVTEAFLSGADEALNRRELIKITVLKSAGLPPKDALAEIARRLSAQAVCSTGGKIVLYRRSKSDRVKRLELP